MAKQRPPQPTKAELKILTVLWGRGPSTLRQIHNVIVRGRKVGLTTTLKTVQIMTAKGLLVRDRSGFPSRYAAAVQREQTQAELFHDLVRRAFDGSPAKLLMRAVQEGEISDNELRDVQRLIDRVRRSRREGGR